MAAGESKWSALAKWSGFAAVSMFNSSNLGIWYAQKPIREIGGGKAVVESGGERDLGSALLGLAGLTQADLQTKSQKVAGLFTSVENFKNKLAENNAVLNPDGSVSMKIMAGDKKKPIAIDATISRDGVLILKDDAGNRIEQRTAYDTAS
ncbi:Uncharacterised protein [uncultured archaeon]|nr:Uncharacterised protein [uncultured archaeon]